MQAENVVKKEIKEKRHTSKPNYKLFQNTIVAAKSTTVKFNTENKHILAANISNICNKYAVDKQQF